MRARACAGALCARVLAFTRVCECVRGSTRVYALTHGPKSDQNSLRGTEGAAAAGRIAALCMSSVSSWRTLMSSWSHEKPTLVEWLPGSRAGSVGSTSGSAAASSSLICAKACPLVVAEDDGEIDGAPSGRRVQRVVANTLQLIHRHEFTAEGGTNGGSSTRGQHRGRKTCVCVLSCA